MLNARFYSKRLAAAILVSSIGAMLAYSTVLAQEQSRESMAVDATASQWSYQFALEGFFDYKTDTLENGTERPPGNEGFLQFRLVAPMPKSEKIPLTLLPRLTLRLVKNADKDIGFGSSDIFILGIMQQWSTGRWGFGPQINFPAKAGFGSTNWGYGLAAALTQRAAQDKLFMALLLQQTWRKRDDGITAATPLSINPSFVVQLGKGVYIGNGDYVINYDWHNKALFVPFGVRLGKAWVGPETTWNAYIEYASGEYYSDWQGSVASHAIRVNVQFQIPVSFGG
jgi:hypothetical protein